jgi:hypothetical protein
MNTSSPRLKRTRPERVGPIRTAMSARPTGEPNTGAPRDPIGMAGAAVRGALENGVRTAYTVIDEYLRRGQETARTVFQTSYWRGPMNNDRDNFGTGFPPGNPMSMLSEQLMLAMRMWTQTMTAFVPSPWAQPGAAPFPSAEMRSPAMTVTLSASRPIEVSVTIYSASEGLLLVSEPLRAEGFAALSIDPPTLVREQGSIGVTLNIAAEQPAGRYRGLIRRESDKTIAGEVTARVV